MSLCSVHSGERLQSFGTKGSGQGQFHYPCGVAVDCNENILVADFNNNRIQKFTAQGKFLTAVGGPDFPRGIVFNASNSRIYVAENFKCRIQVLNSDLSYIGTIGKKGSGKGEFRYPRHLACDSTGNCLCG